jgi:hypothetical protein
VVVEDFDFVDGVIAPVTALETKIVVVLVGNMAGKLNSIALYFTSSSFYCRMSIDESPSPKGRANHLVAKGVLQAQRAALASSCFDHLFAVVLCVAFKMGVPATNAGMTNPTS